MWLRIRSLIVKELLAVWRDPKGRFILLVPPVIQMLIFAFAATQEVKNVRIAVLNQDMGHLRARPGGPLRGLAEFPRGRPPPRRAEIAPAIDSRSVLMVVHIGRTSRAGGRGPAGIGAAHPRRPQLERRPDPGRLRRSRSSSDYNAELAPDPARPPPPASVVVARVWFNPNLDALWSTVPSLVGILMALEGLMVTGLSVARERELGTFEQLLVSPLSSRRDRDRQDSAGLPHRHGRGDAHGHGRRVRLSRPAHGLGRAACTRAWPSFCSPSSASGCSSRRWRRRSSRRSSGTFSFMVPMMLLSGFASPIENMPDWLQYADAGQPGPALHGDRQGRVPEGDAGRRRAEQPLAAGRDRGGNSRRVHAAVPPAGRVTRPSSPSVTRSPARWGRRFMP